MRNDSKIGGILSIISGAFGVLSILMYILIIIMVVYASRTGSYSHFPYTSETLFIVYIVYGIMGLVTSLLGILAIIGGVFALKGKYWGWSLAGAIAATITFFPCGIASIIFIAKSQAEFKPSMPIYANNTRVSDLKPTNTPPLSS
jgi:hypothetical protein